MNKGKIKVFSFKFNNNVNYMRIRIKDLKVQFLFPEESQSSGPMACWRNKVMTVILLTEMLQFLQDRCIGVFGFHDEDDIRLVFL